MLREQPTASTQIRAVTLREAVRVILSPFPMSPPGEITFENATASYGRFVAMGPASIRIHPGEVLAIVGPSGCGKSTFLNLIAGTLRPSSGQVLYNRRPIDGPNRDV